MRYVWKQDEDRFLKFVLYGDFPLDSCWFIYFTPHPHPPLFQGADGVRGLKGSKGEKVSEIDFLLRPKYVCACRQIVTWETLDRWQYNDVIYRREAVSRYHPSSVPHRVKTASPGSKVTWVSRETGWEWLVIISTVVVYAWMLIEICSLGINCHFTCCSHSCL